jgi:hypothetical protein
MSMDDIIASLSKKQKPAGPEMAPSPDSLSGPAPVAVALDPERVVRIIRDLVDNGSRGGALGATGAHLAALVEPAARRHHPSLHQNLTVFLSYIVNGFFQGEIKDLLLCSDLIGIPKKSGDAADARPIAMGEVLYKAAAHCSLDRLGDLKKIFPKIQYGVGTTGGSQAAIHIIRAALKAKPNLPPAEMAAALRRRIALAVDFKNAFNSLSRHAMMEILLGDLRTSPIWNFVHWSYADPSALLVFDNMTNILSAVLHSEDGVRQGDPLAAFLFAFAVQSLYVAALKAAKEVEGVAILDDLTLIGDYENVFKVYDKLLALAPSYGLELQQPKCQVLMPNGFGPTNTVSFQPILDECSTRHLRAASHIHILGIVIGNGTLAADQKCQEHVDDAVASHRGLFQLLAHPLMPPQIGALLLRMCMVPRMMYFARTIAPQDLHQAALEFDRQVLECFTAINDINVAMAPLTPSEHMIVSLPISKGGFGIKQSTQTLHAAYMASLVPLLPTIKKLLPAARFVLSDSPISDDIESCLSELAHLGLTSSKLLELGIDTGGTKHENVWSHAGPTGSAVNTKRRALLQNVLTKQIEAKLQEDFYGSLPPDDPLRTILLSSSGRAASLWLTCIPTERALQMSAIEFQHAVRMRLGRLPSDLLINQICSCGAILKDQPHTHFLDCPRMQVLRNKAHDSVRDAVASFATQCHRGSMGHVVVEPGCRDYVDSSKPYSRERADIVIVNRVTSTMTDITISDPCGKSNAKLPGIRTVPMVSVAKVVAAKFKHHSGRAAESHLKLCIFAIETLGAINPAGIRLLGLIARSADADARRSEISSLYYYGASLVSVTLQKSLAKISEHGCSFTSLASFAG